MSEVRAVIFDMGRVLVDIQPSLALLDRFGIDPQEDFTAIVQHPVFRKYNKGELTPQEYHLQFCELSGFHLPFDRFVDLWCSIFVPMDGMQALVNDVAQKVVVNLLSDTDPLHWGYIGQKWPWIAKTFSEPVLSFQIGMMKPDPGTYLAACEKIGMKPSECLFIDDLSGNVDGAKKLGMVHSFVFSGPEDARKRLVDLGVLD